MDQEGMSETSTIVSGSEQNNTNMLLKQASEHFNDGDYQKSLEIYNTILEDSENPKLF